MALCVSAKASNAWKYHVDEYSYVENELTICRIILYLLRIYYGLIHLQKVLHPRKAQVQSEVPPLETFSNFNE